MSGIIDSNSVRHAHLKHCYSCGTWWEVMERIPDAWLDARYFEVSCVASRYYFYACYNLGEPQLIKVKSRDIDIIAEVPCAEEAMVDLLCRQYDRKPRVWVRADFLKASRKIRRSYGKN